MKRRILAIMLLLSMLVSLVACSGGEVSEAETTTKVETIDKYDGYDFGELDCQDADFTFLQCDEGRWNMKTALVPESMAGDTVSDAVYKRNSMIEDLYNVNLKCINVDMYETGNYINTMTFSGDATVDVAFVNGESVPNLISAKSLNDIASTPNIQIYKPWWSQMIVESSQFSGSSSVYYAQSDISLTAFELTWCVVANLDIIENNKLENPYELVRSGKWTAEKMFQMSKKGMTSNADGSFDYNEGTTCVMGFVTYDNFAVAGINGGGCFFTQKDEIGFPKFTGEGERFIDVLKQWADFSSDEGVALAANDRGFHYEEIFSDARSVFVGSEVKGVSRYKTTNINYGILPVPKYDEQQERYYSNVNYVGPVLVIPVTNVKHDVTGRILDTMAFLSYKDVLPEYYGVNLSYQALQDPESVEMLNIIRDTRCYETSLLFGWTTDYYSAVRKIFIGVVSSTTISSEIANNREKVKTNIDNYFAKNQ